MSESIAGQFSIEALALVNQHQQSIDIRDLVQEFRLNESIHNKFCSATFAIADGIDLIKNYKLTGQEFIRVSIKQKEGAPAESEDAVSDFSIDKTFRIFKIDALMRDNVQAPMQQYLIRCVEPRLYTCRRTRLSRVFRGSYDDILENIFVNYAKIKEDEFDHWEETLPDNIQYIAPNWTVGSVIDHVVNHASLGTNSVYRNGMFFYQTLNGGFRFKSIDKMFEDEFPVTFSMYPRTSTADTTVIDVNAAGGVNSQIISIEKPQLFDTLQGTVGGAYASKLEAYDPVRKLSEDAIYDLDETFNRKKEGHLSRAPMIHMSKEDGEYFLTTENQTDPTTAPPITQLDADLSPNEYNNDQREALVVNTYSMNHSWDDANDVEADPSFKGVESKDNSKLERMALLEILEQNRCIVTIPLRTDLSVGTVIKLELPPSEPAQETTIKDQLNDGRYLITDIAIVAQPQKNRGEVVIECSKESFAKEPKAIFDFNNINVAEEI